jgi:pyrimidine-nucleoside phosphorylase
MIGQTARIAPADKRIYALRDVTATVETIPLIVASILSKKLAEGIDALVLDVKVGRGAFMKTEAAARALAVALVRVGTAAGKRVVALLTDMSAPLGLTIGNALETREAIELLHGKGPADLLECTLSLGAEMLLVGNAAKDDADAREKLRNAIASGDALRVLERMIAAQHGDARVAAHPELLPRAPEVVELRAEETGFVEGIDALTLGLAAVSMGAGRTRVDQAVDPVVGIELAVSRGARVERGQPLARIHVRTRAAADDVAARVRSAFRLSPTPTAEARLVLDRITA